MVFISRRFILSYLALCSHVFQSCLPLCSPRLGKKELVYMLLVHLIDYLACVTFGHFFTSSWCQALPAA